MQYLLFLLTRPVGTYFQLQRHSSTLFDKPIGTDGEAAPPRLFCIRESICCIRVIFGRFIENMSLR